MEARPYLPPYLTRQLAWIVIATSLLYPSCSRQPSSEKGSQARDGNGSPLAELFVDQAQASGLDFFHFNGMSGEYFLPEMTGGGGALFDYDNDGDLDIYLVQGALLGEGKTIDDALLPPRHSLPPRDRLYRNELEVDAESKSRLRFTDVTAASGMISTDYGMGVTSGDFDNDGWVDLYVTGLRANHLLRNKGDGTFVDVTARSGTVEQRWSVAAIFLDYDWDGWLDLYVGNYVDFTLPTHKICHNESGAPDYCGPLAYEPVPDRLWRNQGDGTFEDVSLRAGPGRVPGSTLGVVSADFDGDGWPDLYVANDQMANELWLNQGDGSFKNQALLSGSAVNREGQPEASMGVDAADFDNDADEDLFMAHLSRETNTLYVNRGGALFDDRSRETGLGAPSWDFTGFGTGWFDYDGDGWLDLLVANGAVKTLEDQVRAGEPYPLRQPNQLFRNLGDARFEEVSQRAGSALTHPEVSRGAAFGDIDNDGDTDVLIVNNGGQVRLLMNQMDRRGTRWLGLRLMTQDGKRDALGAWVGVFLRGEKALWRRVRTGGSYASASDPRLLFGLGDGGAPVERIRVRWSHESTEEWDSVPLDAYTTLRQGTGRPVP